MKITVRLAVLVCCGFAAAPGGLAQSNVGWTLVWSDEFTQANGSSPDPAKWTFDTGAGGWGNSELEYYTSRTNNTRIENGQLVIEARQESYDGSSYTSARLKTQGKASWTYGRIEARLKIPRTQGIWPAFWMLGTNITSVSWPSCGEVDIMENIAVAEVSFLDSGNNLLARYASPVFNTKRIEVSLNRSTVFVLPRGNR